MALKRKRNMSNIWHHIRFIPFCLCIYVVATKAYPGKTKSCNITCLAEKGIL